MPAYNHLREMKPQHEVILSAIAELRTQVSTLESTLQHQSLQLQTLLNLLTQERELDAEGNVVIELKSPATSEEN